MRSRLIVIIVAVLVGVMYCAPQIAFVFSLGKEYRGIPFAQVDDAEIYFSRMHELTDGHLMVGSPVFFDYKNELPLLPPTGEALYVALHGVTGMSLSSLFILTQFLFPALLFALVYYASRAFMSGADDTAKRIYAVCAGLVVTLGYDLVDYKSAIGMFTGTYAPGSFLLWARPVNPIIGALLIFAFLVVLLRILATHAHAQKVKKIWYAMGMILLALMMMTYFFTWAFMACALATLLVLSAVQKKWRTVVTVAVMGAGASILALPYWYTVYRAAQSPWYKDAQSLMGVFHIRTPFPNKVLLVALALVVYMVWRQRHKGIRDSYSVLVSLVVGGLVALNQQLLTGVAIWPYHFVQYTIPISIVVVFVVLNDVIAPCSKRLAYGIGVACALIAVFHATYTQGYVYARFYAHSVYRERYGDITRWLDANTTKDSVVLVNEPHEDLARAIPAYSHDNVYVSTYRFTLIPHAHERFLNNYFSLLRVRGITPVEVQNHPEEYTGDLTTYTGTNWQSILSTPGISPLHDTVLEYTRAHFAELYGAYYSRDFLTVLREYRIDYIISQGVLLPSVEAQLHNPILLKAIDGFYVYRLATKS